MQLIKRVSCNKLQLGAALRIALDRIGTEGSAYESILVSISGKRLTVADASAQRRQRAEGNSRFPD